MNKKLFLVPMALLLCTSMVACGQKNNKGSSGAGSQSASSSSAQLEKIAITAAGDKTTLKYGETVQLSSSVEGVEWILNKDGVVTISNTGLVTAVAEGSVTVKATKAGYKDGSISIKVQFEKIEVTAAESKTSLLVDETVQLTANQEGVTWTSSDESVATVSATGLVKAVKYGTATITASKEHFAAGSVSISVVRPAPTAKLHLEDADHESADGWYSSSSSGSERGPGKTPIYSKESASDGTCVAYLGEGDTETLKFTSSAAVKAEILIYIGYYYSIEDVSKSFSVKFNNADASIAGQAYESEDTTNYTYKPVSIGEVNLVQGENTLLIEILGADGAYIPYFDDVEIYAASATNIAVVAAPTKQDITVQDAALTVEQTAKVSIVPSISGCRYYSESTSIATVDDNGEVTGVGVGTTNIRVIHAGYYTTRVAVTVTEKLIEGEIRLEAEDFVVEGGAITTRTPSSSSKASGAITNAWPVDEVLTVTFDAKVAGEMDFTLVGRANPGDTGYTYTDVDLATDIEIKFNDVKLALEGTISGSTIQPYELGKVNVKLGSNTFTIKNLNLAPAIDYFKIAPHVDKPDTPAHEHAWTAATAPAQGATDVALSKFTCACGDMKYEFAGRDKNGHLEGNSTIKNTTAEGYMKLTSNGHSISYTFTLDKAFSGKIYQNGFMDNYSDNASSRIYYRDSGNIEVTVNDEKVAIDSSMIGAKFSDVFGANPKPDSTQSIDADVLIGDVNLKAGQNTLVFKRTETLNLSIAKFVFIGK